MNGSQYAVEWAEEPTNVVFVPNKGTIYFSDNEMKLMDGNENLITNFSLDNSANPQYRYVVGDPMRLSLKSKDGRDIFIQVPERTLFPIKHMNTLIRIRDEFAHNGVIVQGMHGFFSPESLRVLYILLYLFAAVGIAIVVLDILT